MANGEELLEVDRERLELELGVEVEVIIRNVGVEWTNYNIIEYLSLLSPLSSTSFSHYHPSLSLSGD